jgi:YafQ family addiction module toxin component
MEYQLQFTPFFEKQLKKLKKKDSVLFDRLGKKIKEIKNNPEHYKPLKNILKGNRRAHLDPFIIIFDINIEKNLITMHYVKHHDKAY